MRKNARILLALIVVLTILAIVIDLPRVIPIKIDTTIPLINKKIAIHKNIQGFNPNFYIGSYHFQQNLGFKKGLDLEGGTSLTLKADMKDIKAADRDAALSSAALVIRRRIDLFGVSEPIVQTAKVNNDYRLIVELPGISDINQAVSLIGTTAQLTFWEAGTALNTKTATSSGVPTGLTSVPGLSSPHKTDLTGNDLQDSTVTFDSQTGQPQVNLVFTPSGTTKFADISRRNVGKIVAIVLDNQVVEAPTIQQAILTGNAVITGQFTTDQANLLSNELKAGALPVPLSILQQQAIGATLGQSSLNKSVFAGLLGFLIIVLFMSILYGRLGAIASVALLLYTLFVLAIFKLFGVTLTLAGIAGFILSIGMAVDANILIFERMREELRLGKTRPVAIELGFTRAWTSIRDSNLSSIITASILLWLGTGVVKGFAVTLLIGVIISMFSAIVVTRTLLRLIYNV